MFMDQHSVSFFKALTVHLNVIPETFRDYRYFWCIYAAWMFSEETTWWFIIAILETIDT